MLTSCLQQPCRCQVIFISFKFFFQFTSESYNTFFCNSFSFHNWWEISNYQSEIYSHFKYTKVWINISMWLVIFGRLIRPIRYPFELKGMIYDKIFWVIDLTSLCSSPPLTNFSYHVIYNIHEFYEQQQEYILRRNFLLPILHLNWHLST